MEEVKDVRVIARMISIAERGIDYPTYQKIFVVSNFKAPLAGILFLELPEQAEPENHL
ncbi:MAG: hypothetical protein IPI78_17025 [Chitinophagaceae bacterium]|nr:hypothetical protein [Chitinophagaceae bacterium]